MKSEAIDPRDEVLNKQEAARFLRVSLRAFDGLWFCQRHHREIAHDGSLKPRTTTR